MRFFAALTTQEEYEIATLHEPNRILMSYHYFKTRMDLIHDAVKNNYDVIIDSGAFSSKNSGVEIDIDKYCEFIKKSGVKKYASLDVIGDAQKSLEYCEYMENHHGLKPIPTFHMGSLLEDLIPLIDKYDHIALGGMVFSSGIMNHCDKVWSTILNRKPTLKVHGFGLTNVELMKRYPWTSVDSSSYKSCQRFGRQMILNSDFEFNTITEDEFLKYLKTSGHIIEGLMPKQKRTIYSSFACREYHMLASHLKIVNKTKDFSYLTDQLLLF